MNAYEQFRNRFLVELEAPGREMSYGELMRISSALDRAAYGFEITEKMTALTIPEDPIPGLVKTYLVVKKTEGLAEGTLQNYLQILRAFFLWCRKRPEEVTSNDIRMFLYDYQINNRVSDRTLDKYRQMICWFFWMGAS